MDCTDCSTYEPQPFDPSNFSVKVNGPGLRYEVGLGIQSGDIVWVNGPFQPGVFNDDSIAKQKGFCAALGPRERFLADSIYSGWRPIVPTGRNNADEKMKNRARARHETVNARLKRFGALKQVFRHRLDQHGSVFHAIATICQVEIEEGSHLFPVDYDDLRYHPYDF